MGSSGRGILPCGNPYGERGSCPSTPLPGPGVLSPALFPTLSPALSPALTPLVPPSAGIYVCAKCGHELFSSRAKYEHSSPWPAFTETLRGDSVTCGKCGNGLGHEFLNDGPRRGQSRF
uniref:Methionine sulfoxide reductase B1 n=1 Tax=Zosterops lateralis melanops TaxID=1220523 RepID=A0A8D2QRM2_ZOSLA